MEVLSDIDTNQPEFADFYDELPLWSAPFGLMLLDRAPLKPGISILDVGAGTGFTTIELAQRCGPASTVIAVDPWPAVVARLRRKLQFLHLANVRVLEQDAASIDLASDSIDLVVSNLGINNFDRPDAVLKASWRVMKPGAEMILTTNLVGHMWEFYNIYRQCLIDLGLTDRLEALEKHINHRATINSVTQLLARVGFDLVDVTRSAFQFRFADGSSLLRHHFIRFAFLPDWKAVLEPAQIESTFTELENRLNAASLSRGELSLTIPTACIEARKPETPAA